MTEDNKYLDKLFQRKFAGFEAEPPASVWTNVHNELHNKGGGSNNPVNLAVLAALVLISGLLGFRLIHDVPDQSNEIDPALLTSLFIADNQNNPYTGSLPSTSTNDQIRSIEPKKPLNSTILSGEHAPETKYQQHALGHSAQINTLYAPSFDAQSKLSKMKARKSLSVHAGLQIPGSENIRVRNSRYHPKFAGVNDGERSYNRRASWQMGFFFTPEVGFYPNDSIPNQRSYTFDVSAKWQKNEFFIESGLGISYSSDDGNYAIDYEQFLGSYNDVYNVTYDTASNGSLVPVYHTNVVNVYDSISKYKVDQTRNTYTYLQLPVYVGFQKQVNRFGWFVKGGPVLSLLVHKNIPEPEAGYNRIIGLDRQMATRVNTHWQLAFSVGMSYQLSNKVSIGIEPTFRYSLNSQYERKYISTRHPYSIGLRTGLLFNF
ncbi:MAG: hypothetical protein RQ761_06025 [Bacteroidales bacterium]|nr:hypothetical protein [Bacteroidales bacterium]